MNWISVEDRLPEYGALVLVYIKEIKSYVSAVYYSNDRFKETMDFMELKKTDISHWCEITEPSQQRVIPKVPKKDRAIGK